MIRAALPTACLAGVIAVAGCGGGGGGDTAKAPTPANQGSASSGKVVSADGTLGLVGPAGRATSKLEQFADKKDKDKISPNANRKTDALKHGVAAGDACNDAADTPSEDNIAQLDAAILCLVNAERADNGLPALNHASELDQSSDGMCKRMVSEHFFSHETPDGKTVVDRVQPTGYIPKSGDWVVGENLAWGSGALSTPQSIVNGWMNSPGHRANILAPDYKDIGLAACMGSPTTTNSGGTVYVNNFGAKSGADVNATLPGHTSTVATTSDTGGDTNGDTNGNTGNNGPTAGASKAKKRAACARKAKKAKSSRKRSAALKRCRRL